MRLVDGTQLVGKRRGGADIAGVAISELHLPPGQQISSGSPVVHYGPVPRFKPDRWTFDVFGATASSDRHSWTLAQFADLPSTGMTADMHCVTRFSVLNNQWEGVPASALLELAPPAPEVRHVMVWAEYGFSANIRLADFTASLLATHRNGELLSLDRGYPLRIVVPHLYAWKSVKWLRAVEYLSEDRRGFWEDRGYHNVADPWREQRYAYQELPGEGPPV